MSDKPGLRNRVGRYAAEFTVIFLGVWLSLMAEEWRQARQDRETESDALNGLVQDLAVDISDMTGNLGRANRSLQAAARLLRVESGTAPTSAELAGLLSELGPCSFPQWNTSQYTTLKASGDLNLIRDPSLRASIASYYEGLSGLAWLHDVDCSESRSLFEALPPIAELVFPEAPVSGRTREFSATVARITDPSAFEPGSAVLDRIAKLAAHRDFLAFWIDQELTRARSLQASIASALEGRRP